MTPAEALEQIRGFAAANRYRLHPHAWDRLCGLGRNVYTTLDDVAEALRKAHTARVQNNERWRIEGPDLDGEDLTLIVVFDDGVLVVTVM